MNRFHNIYPRRDDELTINSTEQAAYCVTNNGPLRVIEEGLASTFLHFPVALAFASTGGRPPEGLDLRLQSEDTQRSLLEVLVQPLDLALHAALQLQDILI